MSLQLLVILGLILATLLCAVVTVLLYRRSKKTWYWPATAIIGGVIADILYIVLLNVSSISRQLTFILGLVLAALLYAVAILLYRRSGVSTKTWYAFIGVAAAALLFFTLVGFFFIDRQTVGILLPFLAYTGIISVLWQRSRTR